MMGPVFITVQFQLGDELCRSVINGTGDRTRREAQTRHSTSFFEGTKLSPACPSDHSGKFITRDMEHCRNGIDNGKPKFWKTTGLSGTLSTTSQTVFYAGTKPASPLS
jgi:hypothetical protein